MERQEVQTSFANVNATNEFEDSEEWTDLDEIFAEDLSEDTSRVSQPTASTQAVSALASDTELLAKEDADLLEQMKSIPDKMAFKIGEVAEMAGVKQYVLRYWETEFEALRPKKSRHGQRMYKRKDIETVLLIKKLLYVDRFSIDGARSALTRKKKEVRRKTNLQESFEQVAQVTMKVRQLKESIQQLRERL